MQFFFSLFFTATETRWKDGYDANFLSMTASVVTFGNTGGKEVGLVTNVRF